jgi:hypothetical protein
MCSGVLAASMRYICNRGSISETDFALKNQSLFSFDFNNFGHCAQYFGFKKAIMDSNVAFLSSL